MQNHTNTTSVNDATDHNQKPNHDESWHTDYIAAGGNRHPASADWDPQTGIVAYGSQNNIAIWYLLVSDNRHPTVTAPHNSSSSFSQHNDHKGVTELLHAHTDTVNAVKFHSLEKDNAVLLFSGSVDKSVKVSHRRKDDGGRFKEAAKLEGHTGSINDLAATTVSSRRSADEAVIVASASADGTIRIWRLIFSGVEVQVFCLQTLQTTPLFLPLALIMGTLGDEGGIFLVAAGTKGAIQLYAADKNQNLKQQASLLGHGGWIRSLAVASENDEPGSDLILASASQDKYIRLWRIHFAKEETQNGISDLDKTSKRAIRPLKSKEQRFQNSSASAAVTFEALLVGHEDWIFTVSWRRSRGKLRLLSSSADNSLAIWERDETSGIWLCSIRLGEISAQKGSTTATGSTGGFSIGLWSPDGDGVLSLGRTGSWRLWQYEEERDRWVQGTGTGGHLGSITGIAWAGDGSYLLSTSSDQTTRLHAEWKRESGQSSWHEMARPQIHGYDLNCIDTITDTQFISGADEKCLRVFDQPRATAELLQKLSKTDTLLKDDMPDAADIPVLGLSNKAVENLEKMDGDPPQTNGEAEDNDTPTQPTSSKPQPQDTHHPPHEDLLARHTLWPECEKLYGHGFEISTVAASHNGLLVATACKASSIDHAVIRLYDTKEWREIKPSLQAHSLTVTCLKFSPDDRCLLSAGRDRQWVLWEREEGGDEKVYTLKEKNPKAHSRMILGTTWVRGKSGPVFLTAGRDKTIKAWKIQDQGSISLVMTILAPAAVTAIDARATVFEYNSSDSSVGGAVLAYGTESGEVLLHRILGDLHLEGQTNLSKGYVKLSRLILRFEENEHC